MQSLIESFHSAFPYGNEVLWVLYAFINFLLILAIYRWFGRTGLFAWLAFSTVLANIQVTQTIELFGLTATLGNILYGSIFLITDALNEKYGLQEAKRAVFIGFFTLAGMALIMQGALQFMPLGGTEDTVHRALDTIFSMVPRIVLGSVSAYLISQLIDVHIFQRIKSRLPSDRLLYIRNLGSTALSQLLDSAIFVPIAFLGVHENVFEIFLTTYAIKLIVALLDTPFIYIIKGIHPLPRNG